MNQQSIITELHQFKAQALTMVNWAEQMIEKIEAPKKKGLSESEINKALNKRRKVKTSNK